MNDEGGKTNDNLDDDKHPLDRRNGKLMRFLNFEIFQFYYRSRT